MLHFFLLNQNGTNIGDLWHLLYEQINVDIRKKVMKNHTYDLSPKKMNGKCKKEGI